ncbi:MAG: hypothetical protein AAF411_25635 [Myxococcota bacterium]
MHRPPFLLLSLLSAQFIGCADSSMAPETPGDSMEMGTPSMLEMGVADAPEGACIDPAPTTDGYRRLCNGDIACDDCFIDDPNPASIPGACYDGCNWCDCGAGGLQPEACTARFCGPIPEEERLPAAMCGDQCQATDEAPPADYAGESACLTPCGWCTCTADGANRCEGTNGFCHGPPLEG